MPDFVIFGLEQNNNGQYDLWRAKLKRAILQAPEVPGLEDVPLMIDLRQFGDGGDMMAIHFFCGHKATADQVKSVKSILENSIRPVFEQVIKDKKVCFYRYATGERKLN